MDNHIVLHIPHSSLFIDKEQRQWITLTDEELEQEKLYMADRYTDELFGGADKVVFSYSRLICDVERFLDIDNVGGKNERHRN